MILFIVLLSAYAASGALYHADLSRFLGDLPVTKFDSPGFVDRNFTAEEIADCRNRRGHFLDGQFIGTASNYSILDILQTLGGAPGEVDAPRRENVFDLNVENLTKRPFEDAPKDKWLYDYRATDYKYYYRLEHAVKRFAGTDKEFLDIRGQLAWTPEDTCGHAKVADYLQDDTGFSSKVRNDYCNFVSDKRFTCATITYCSTKANGDQLVCIG